VWRPVARDTQARHDTVVHTVVLLHLRMVHTARHGAACSAASRARHCTARRHWCGGCGPKACGCTRGRPPLNLSQRRARRGCCTARVWRLWAAEGLWLHEAPRQSHGQRLRYQSELSPHHQGTLQAPPKRQINPPTTNKGNFASTTKAPN
jgi:hypothetical protein